MDSYKSTSARMRSKEQRKPALNALPHLHSGETFASGIPLPRPAGRYLPVRAPISVRKVIKKSTASCRYSVPAVHCGDDATLIREMESALEYRIFVCLEVHPEVARIDTQAMKVGYHDPAYPKDRRHFPDLVVQTHSGLVIGILVKPWAKSQDPEFLHVVEAMRNDHVPKLFDRILVRTERNFSATQLENALLIRNYRRAEDHEADEIIESSCSHLVAETNVRSLVNCTGLGPRGFPAIVRAIGKGHLSVRKDQLIDPDGWVLPKHRPTTLI